MPIDSHLKAQLEEIDDMYGGDNIIKILGPTMLSYTSTDSAREYMFTSHIKQTLNLLNPDVPRLQTGMENAIGEVNHAYCRLDGTWEVLDIIQKFPDRGIYTLVLYNKKTDTYDMIEKKIAENLTEKFGYVYNTDFMDHVKVGDKLKDAILYKSTSYDEHMNYRYGKNANVYFSTSTDTLEDAIRVRRSWAEGVKSVEVDLVQVPVNDNDVMLNLYGDDSVYKTFPDIGEHVKNSMLCATRRINKNHLLYDFQTQNMATVYSTDADYYVSKDAEVYDIEIYYNGDDPFPDTLFYQQMKFYYECCCQYADKMYAWATRIKKSGSKYTENVTYFRSRYKNYTNPEYKWKNKDRAFSNIVIEFHVKSVVSLEAGSKLTGRYGDKGVIGDFAEDLSEQFQESIVDMVAPNATEEEKRRLAKNIQIVDDVRMPYSDDVKVDILLNSSGAVRRINPGQLSEVEVNFQAAQVQKYIREQCKTREEKIAVIWKFLKLVNAAEMDFYWKMYQSFDQFKQVGDYNFHIWSDAAKDAFIKDIEENGFYLIKPPHTPLAYDDIQAIYNEFPFIKPYPIYIDLFGIKKRRVMKDGIIGSKYILVLKQNSNKNFSARSTFRVNRANLPTKDVAKKTNRSSYARTPVRLSEIYNIMASNSGLDLAEYNIFMRSSALGRKSLQRILAAEGNPMLIDKLKVQDNFINANADILNAKLKGIGLEIKFYTEADPIPDIYSNAKIPMRIGDYTILCSYDEKPMYRDLLNRFDAKMKEFTMLESYQGEKHDVCWKQVFEDSEVKKYQLSDEKKDLLVTATKGIITILEEVKPTSKASKEAEENLEKADLYDENGNKIPQRRRRKKATTDTEEKKPND